MTAVSWGVPEPQAFLGIQIDRRQAFEFGNLDALLDEIAAATGFDGGVSPDNPFDNSPAILQPGHFQVARADVLPIMFAQLTL